MGMAAEEERLSPEECAATRIERFLRDEFVMCRTQAERDVVLGFYRGEIALTPRMEVEPQKPGSRAKPRRRVRPWPEGIVDFALREIAAGYTDKEIADVTGCPVSTVDNWRKKGKPVSFITGQAWRFNGRA